ncbi:MAG: hydrogenase iron-sulfur subunit, partial [Candidatus Hydrothermarchaeota archaeon]|nr:hydrogenase iron-sulfur subunit [Candidatus Hydrothermarchaeota archaeon]
ERRVDMLYDLLEDLGIEKERLLLKWISAAEGELFATVMREFTEKLEKLGPSPLKIRLDSESLEEVQP